MTKKQPEQPPMQESVEDVAARLSEEILLDSPEPEKEHQHRPEWEVEVPVSSLPIVDSPETAKEAAGAIGDMDIAALKAELKAQIMDELKDDQVKRMELEKERRERETAEQQSYIAKMKASPDPWVDIVGWVKDSNGVRTELEWNDAFVDYLRSEGVTGVDDDNVVHKWVAIMMHDMANRMDDQQEEPSEFAG